MPLCSMVRQVWHAPPVPSSTRHSNPKFSWLLLLWFEPLYETLGLPKLNGMAINRNFCKPPRLLLVRTADVNSIGNVVILTEYIGAIFFHRTLPTISCQWVARLGYGPESRPLGGVTSSGVLAKRRPRGRSQSRAPFRRQLQSPRESGSCPPEWRQPKSRAPNALPSLWLPMRPSSAPLPHP